MLTEDSLILVTGCPRSGSSVMAGILSICGGFTGDVDKMYENLRIQDFIIKKYLYNVGIGINAQYPLDINYNDDGYILMKMLYGGESGVLDRLKNQIIQELTYQGYTTGIAIYKDCRLLLIQEEIHTMFPRARWIVVRRKDEDILNSCMKTSYMNSFKYQACRDALHVNTEQDGWIYMINRYKEFINTLKDKTPENQIKEVWLNNTNWKELVEWAGLCYRGKEVNEFINHKLKGVEVI